MRFRLRERRKPTINIVSMIDILCILLIFFIVTTVFKKDEPAVKIDLPDSTQATVTKQEQPTIIYVTAKDEVYLDSQPVPVEQLAATLTQKSKDNPQLKLALKSSKHASFGMIIKIMDATRAAGIKQLPAFTEEAPKDAQP